MTSSSVGETQNSPSGTYRLGGYRVKIMSVLGGWVRYEYLNPSPRMERNPDGRVYGRIAAAAFAAQAEKG